MTTDEADDILATMARHVYELENDEELYQLDPRYSILASFIDLDLNYVEV
jgi:hypothetical protein